MTYRRHFCWLEVHVLTSRGENVNSEDRRRIEELVSLFANAKAQDTATKQEAWRWSGVLLAGTMYVFLAIVLSSKGLFTLALLGLAAVLGKLAMIVWRLLFWERTLLELSSALFKEGSAHGERMDIKTFPCGSQSWQFGEWEFGFIRPGEHPPRRTRDTMDITVLDGALWINQKRYLSGSNKTIPSGRLLCLEGERLSLYSVHHRL